MHLVIDGFGGNTNKMWDDGLVRQFLTDYPESLEMTRITEPRVLVYDAPKPEDSGVSGFVIIAESHISIHTFPRKNYVNIDIFSCRPFDHDRALEDARKLFDLEDTQTWLLDRGLEWLEGGSFFCRVLRWIPNVLAVWVRLPPDRSKHFMINCFSNSLVASSKRSPRSSISVIRRSSWSFTIESPQVCRAALPSRSEPRPFSRPPRSSRQGV